MNNQPTYDDANLILRLYELRREEKLRHAREWYAQGFKTPATIEELAAQCPSGSANNTAFRMVTSYWDMVASFITSGVLNQELTLQSSGELLLVWTKVRDVVSAFRKFLGNPRYLTNLETVGMAAIQRLNTADPKAYDTFVERIVKGMEAAGEAQAASKS